MESTLGAGLEAKMSFEEKLDLAKELAEKWGLEFLWDIDHYELITRVATFDRIDKLIEWIQEEFEDK